MPKIEFIAINFEIPAEQRIIPLEYNGQTTQECLYSYVKQYIGDQFVWYLSYDHQSVITADDIMLSTILGEFDSQVFIFWQTGIISIDTYIDGQSIQRISAPDSMTIRELISQSQQMCQDFSPISEVQIYDPQNNPITNQVDTNQPISTYVQGLTDVIINFVRQEVNVIDVEQFGINNEEIQKSKEELQQKVKVIEELQNETKQLNFELERAKQINEMSKDNKIIEVLVAEKSQLMQQLMEVSQCKQKLELKMQINEIQEKHIDDLFTENNKLKTLVSDLETQRTISQFVKNENQQLKSQLLSEQQKYQDLQSEQVKQHQCLSNQIQSLKLGLKQEMTKTEQIEQQYQQQVLKLSKDLSEEKEKLKQVLKIQTTLENQQQKLTEEKKNMVKEIEQMKKDKNIKLTEEQQNKKRMTELEDQLQRLKIDQQKQNSLITCWQEFQQVFNNQIENLSSTQLIQDESGQINKSSIKITSQVGFRDNEQLEESLANIKLNCGHIYSKNDLQVILTTAISQNQYAICRICSKNIQQNICQLVQQTGQQYLDLKQKLDLQEILKKIKCKNSLAQCSNKTCSFFCIWNSKSGLAAYCPICQGYFVKMSNEVKVITQQISNDKSQSKRY